MEFNAYNNCIFGWVYVISLSRVYTIYFAEMYFYFFVRGYIIHFAERVYTTYFERVYSLFVMRHITFILLSEYIICCESLSIYFILFWRIHTAFLLGVYNIYYATRQYTFLCTGICFISWRGHILFLVHVLHCRVRIFSWECIHTTFFKKEVWTKKGVYNLGKKGKVYFVSNTGLFPLQEIKILK